MLYHDRSAPSSPSRARSGARVRRARGSAVPQPARAAAATVRATPQPRPARRFVLRRAGDQLRPRRPAVAASPRRARSHASRRCAGTPPARWLGFQAMQDGYYILGSGLYKGEPFSFLWPFSQAFAATVTLDEVPALRPTISRELNARLVGLRSYLDTNNSGAPEGTYTSTLAAFDGTVAPPAGPGGAKYYDDNDWIGIELMRAYELTRSPAAARCAPRGSWPSRWPAGRQAPNSAARADCPSRTRPKTPTATRSRRRQPPSWRCSSTKRPTARRTSSSPCRPTNGCAAACFEPNGMYGDHVNKRGIDRTIPVELHAGGDDRRRDAALPGDRQRRLPVPGAPDRQGSARPTSRPNGWAPKSRSSRRSTSATCSTSTRSPTTRPDRRSPRPTSTMHGSTCGSATTSSSPARPRPASCWCRRRSSQIYGLLSSPPSTYF